MDPFLQAMMNSMQGTQALQPTFDAGQGAGTGGPDWTNILAAIKPPEAQQPPMSGGVSGVGAQPFLQQFPDLLTSALQGAFARQQQGSTMPGLGALLAGGR